jgi:hypothetical protein
MSIPRMRLLAVGLAAAGLTAGWLNAAEPPAAAAKPGDAASVATAVQGKPADEGGVRVDAPGTQVTVDKERGKVSVRAPHTDVRVDPDAGRVQVQAPYVNLDIRW